MATRRRGSKAGGHLYVLVFVILVVIVYTQAPGAPAVLECFAAAVSSGAQLMRYVTPSTAKHSS
jgi:hypothetical protein